MKRFIVLALSIATGRFAAMFSVGILINIGLYWLNSKHIDQLIYAEKTIFSLQLIGYAAYVAYFLIFPLAYWFIALSWGLAHAAYYLADQSLQKVLSYLVEKFIHYAQKEPAISEKISQKLTRSLLFETLPNYLEKLPNIPTLFRPILRRVIKKLKLQELFTLAVQKNQDRFETEGITQQLTELVGENLPLKLKSPSIVLFVVVVSFQVLFFIFIYWLHT